MSTKNSMGIRARKTLNNALTYLLLTLLACVILIPIFFVIVTSFKTDSEISLQNFQWLPHSLNFDAFKNAWELVDWPQAFGNSLFITVIVVVGSLFFNSLAGYAFARLEFKGKNVLFLILLMGMMVPAQSIIIPQFVIMRSIPLAGGNNIFGQGGTGFLDSYASLILPFLSGPMGIFLCRQFYSTFPKSLDEAAKIDGCGSFKIYYSIYIPMSVTILATLTILKTVATWNDFFYPLIMTTSDSMKTVQLGLQTFKGSTTTHYNWLMAGTLFTSLPIVIVYLCAQKYFVAGIATSGMKN